MFSYRAYIIPIVGDLEVHNTWYLRAQKDEKALLSSIKVPVAILNLLQGEDFIFLDFPALFDFAPI